MRKWILFRISPSVTLLLAQVLSVSAQLLPTVKQTFVEGRGEILTAGNGIYQIYVQTAPGYGVGQFTITTGPAHGDGPGLNLLHGDGKPGTSFTTIRSYSSGTDYIQGIADKNSEYECSFLEPFGTVTRIGITGFRTTYVLPGPPMTPDALTIIQDVNVTGSTLEDSRIEVTTSTINDGHENIKTGIRYLWDVQAVDDDGPSFRLIGKGRQETTETEFLPPDFDTFAMKNNDGNLTPQNFNIVCSVPDSGNDLTRTPTDRLQFACWAKGFDTAFEYRIDPTCDVATAGGQFQTGFGGGGDSAVLSYFGGSSENSTVVPPGGMQIVSAALFGHSPSAIANSNPCQVNSIKAEGRTDLPIIVCAGESIKFIADVGGDRGNDKVSWEDNGIKTGQPGDSISILFKKTGKHAITARCGGGAPSDPIEVDVVEVVISINSTDSTSDDIVPLKLDNPEQRFNVTCLAKIQPTASKDFSVELKNSDGRLRFPGAADTIKTLVLPKNGSNVSFEISGELVSESLGDAIIEVRDKITGTKCREKKATVAKVEVSADKATKITKVAGNQNIIHFVTPKGQAKSIVTLTATLTPNSQAVKDALTWEGANQDPNNRLKATVSKDAVAKKIVKIKLSALPYKQLEVWVVWSTITASAGQFNTGRKLLDVGVAGPPHEMGLFATYSLDFTHTIAPDTIFTDTDRPDLEGAKDANHDVPGANENHPVTGLTLSGGADKKWDNSRRIKAKLINPSSIPVSHLISPPGLWTLGGSYPSERAKGNDDSSIFDPETNDPYANGSKLTGHDNPLTGVGDGGGIDGDRLEHHIDFQEFTRVQLGDNWYVISEPFPWKLHLKTIKVGGQWIDDGSSGAKDNAGF